MNDVSNDSKYAILYTSKDDCSSFDREKIIGDEFLDDFTEDIYFMHEELLQELEAQYEVNKNMYEQVEIWNELFLEFQEFEVSAFLPWSIFSFHRNLSRIEKCQ